MHWTTDRIRQSFFDFFAERGHTIVPSASLIPKGDPTLLFTNAGMVQFKDYFLGIRTPTSKRVVDCQKCLRISGKHNDLEAVGRDSYHHTFFEMLGNWSFGDYYKEEAIAWHWELITKVWGIPQERLFATVYKDDDEAEQAWLKLKALPKDRILRFGEKANFWEMGETGPCGPCSEIHIDRGVEASKFCPHEPSVCGVNVDACARYIELGNLVFIQYNRDSSGKLTPLPMKHVDTGTGLERVASVLQSIETGRYLGNYDIDLFQKIIASIDAAADHFAALKHGADTLRVAIRYGQSPEADVSFRAIADHVRAICFLLTDGVVPGNTDREYVLRRLIRRAARHGRRLGFHDSFLVLVCDEVVRVMGGAYPELVERQDVITREVDIEEVRFGETLDRGISLLTDAIKQLRIRRQNILPGDAAFRLYDTYGFPLDLTQDICRDYDFTVDVEGFNRLMAEQRERGRAARKDSSVAPEILLRDVTSSRFDPNFLELESEVLNPVVETSNPGMIGIVSKVTPFYPEGGGQIGDRGVIEGESGGLLEVVNTLRAQGTILHLCKVLREPSSDFAIGQNIRLRVDRERRDAAMRNHSATHILHYALREIAGKEVHQAGSLVEPGRLRFDFSHQGPIADGDLLTIEEEINARIRENAAVTTDEMAYDDAIKAGALAFFGDKYGDVVRVVKMGDFSVELCGGTHVNRTGDIGLFKLEAESGVAAGVRRIEAFTGRGALEAIRRREKILEDIGGHLGARDGQAVERLERLIAREKELEKKLRAIEQKLIAGEGGGAGGAEQIREVNGIKVVTRKLDGVDPKALREIADRLRQKHPSAVVALGSDLGDDKAALLIAVTPDLMERVKAGDLVKQLAPIIGGTGGGRPDFAQAGGRDAAKLSEALDRVASLVGSIKT
jgi:alanyl-tRNA synthetase